MTKNHTPTPWVVESKWPADIMAAGGKLAIATALNSRERVFQINSEMPDPSESVANAAFIVRAVNAHDALVEIVKSFVADANSETRLNYNQHSALLRSAKEEIAKATGEI